jgi:hypothetical protein
MRGEHVAFPLYAWLAEAITFYPGVAALEEKP